jgi:phage minor structural protein
VICVYLPDTTDFTSNGLGPIAPLSCRVTETLNGEWEVEMEHPIDTFGKWRRLDTGRIIRVPVPASETPRIELTEPAAGGNREIYKVKTTTGASLRLRSGTGTKYKTLGSYRQGSRVVVLKKTTSSWYEVACPDGKRGYMYASYLEYEKTETTAVVGKGKPVEPRQLRDQPFRIYRITPSLTGLKVYARHVFYDLADNMIRSYKPGKSDSGAVVVQSVSEKCESEHDFTFYSDLTTTAEEVEFENCNPIDAILGEGGVVEKYSAELMRDWYDVFLVERVGKDTSVAIREGKNLVGVEYDVDETDVVTRIMPTGERKNGKVLYLDELYVDSPLIGDYPHPKWYHMPVSEAKVGDDLTEAQAKAKMRQAAQAEYEKGCDLPTISVTVDFVSAADTEDFAQYRALQNIFLGDTVAVIARRIGMAIAMRMTQYTFDCLTQKYESIVLGVATEALEGSTISGKQLPNGEIRGSKLALGSVGAGQLRDGSVGNLHIQNAAIGTAHIATAAINELSANAITALIARIDEIIAGQITTDTLYAALAEVVTLRVGEITAGTLTTDALYAELARIVTLQVKQITADSIATDELYAELARIMVLRVNEIDADTVSTDALYAALAHVVELRAGQITADSIATDALYAALARIVELRVGEINAGTVATDTLYALLANVITLRVEEAVAGTVTTDKLRAAFANIANVEIGLANIDYAKIKDLVTDTAIITTGVSGQLFISRLAVTEANMVSLTVGELLVKGDDGAFYRIGVDEEGNVVTTAVQVEGDNIGDATIPGGKLIENTITAREINVTSLFADSAMIRVIKAANIDVDELFGNAATFGKVTTNHISSDFGASLDLSSNTSISLRVQKIYEDVDALVGHRLEVVATSDLLSEDIQTTTLTARVWHGSQDATDTIPANRFNWRRVSADSTADNLWNAAHTGTKSITLSVLDVQYSATYSCDLTES